MKKFKYNKNYLERKLYNNKEIEKRLLKILYLNLKMVFFKLKLLKKIFKMKIPNRFINLCIVTGRSRSVFTKFKVSRIILRDLSAKGCFFGLKKASW